MRRRDAHTNRHLMLTPTPSPSDSIKNLQSDAEVALLDLQRKYKIMEGNRASYTEDAQGHIRRQRQTIDKLKFDNTQLKTELKSTQSEDARAPGRHQHAEIMRLGDFADLYTRKIEMERRRVEELDQHLALSDAKILEQRKALGGADAAKENDLQIEKQVRVLENKLDKTLTQFNEALAKNKNMRAEIDVLRLERVNFDSVYKKMERDLQLKKKEMSDVIELANISYEARDQAHNEIAALRAQGDREAIAFDSEMRDLGKILDHDRKMKEAEMRNRLKAAELGVDFPGHDSELEAKLKKRGIKGNWAMDAGAKQIAVYEEAFKKIQAATGMSDIDDLVTSFIAAEDQNFSLFNFVNELNQETEKLEETAGELRYEIDKFEGADSVQDAVRKKLVKELELKIEKTNQNTKAVEERLESTSNTLLALRAGIKSTYENLGCDTEMNKELLGDGGVTEQNMLSYLGIVEQRANEVLVAYAAATAAEEGPEAAKKLMGTTGPLSPGRFGPSVTIVPPSTAADERDGSESEDEIDDRPLTREELQQKTMRTMNKREGKGNTVRRGTRKKL